jgi:hypothetical protein
LLKAYFERQIAQGKAQGKAQGRELLPEVSIVRVCTEIQSKCRARGKP